VVHHVFQRILRLGATLAGGLAGVGSLATAVGFLAERSRWRMLGFPVPGADLNEYLFTGARFLAFLPGIVLGSVLSALVVDPWLLLLLLGVAAAAWFVLRSRRMDPPTEGEGRGKEGTRRFLPTWIPRLRPAALVSVILLLFAGTFFLFQAGAAGNLLFADRGHLVGAGCGDPGLGLQNQILLQCEEALVARMGQAFLLVLAGAGALFLLFPPAWRGSEGGRGPGALEGTLLWTGVALVTLQLMLLPVHYGVVFVRNDFPAVQVVRSAPEAREGEDGWPADGRFALLHRRGDEFYLYSSAASRIWLLPRGQVESLVYLGICGVFEPPYRCEAAGGAGGTP